MCKIFVVDDEKHQWEYVREVVYCHNLRHRIIPKDFTMLESRPSPPDRRGWVENVLKVLGNEVPEIAIVDLHLSKPENTRDPEGIWVLEELHVRFPDCYLILVTSKVKLSQIPRLSVAVPGRVSIASSDNTRFEQLKHELDNAVNFAVR